MKKILYIDIPFVGINDGGANRSKFIWNTLISQYEVDWLELSRDGIPKASGLPGNMNDHYQISADIDRRPLHPVMIFHFSSGAKEKFKEIVRNNKYDLIFIRFTSPAKLAKLAEPYCSAIVFDIDMLLSRLSMLSWKQDPVIKNRYYLIESTKQRWFEQKFFQKKYLFLFTNYLEKEMVQQRLKLEMADNFAVLPNVMETREAVPFEEKNRILFFGTLTSAANADAIKFISSEIYPLVESELEKQGLYLDIVGRGWHDHFKEYFENKKRLRYIGEVDDIQQEIANSLFIFLPLRIASGTRTRILEVANQFKAVITTPIGMEGFQLTGEEIIIEDSAEKLAEEFNLLLNNELLRENLGQKLHYKCQELYQDNNVSTTLKVMLENWWKTYHE